MSSEVAGALEGKTLLELIEDGTIANPGKLNWNQWQIWRRELGRRPKRAIDGRSTTTSQESALWKAVMASLHGEEEAERLDADEEEEADTGEQELIPASTEVREASRASVPLPAMLAPPSSPDNKSESSGSANAENLRGRLYLVFDPTKESVNYYRSRVSRLCSALEAMNEEVDLFHVEILLEKASLLDEAFRKANSHGVAYTQQYQGEFFRSKFFEVSNDPELEGSELEVKAIALSELVKAVGGRESTTPGKAFSLPNSGNRPRFEEVPQFPFQEFGPSANERERDTVSLMQAKIAALEIELASKDLDGKSSAGSENQLLSDAIIARTAALTGLLSKRTGRSTITNVRADVRWTTLTDDQTDAKQVKEFYENFEDNCDLANDCDGMNFREKLVALRGRCRGTRLKSYQNIYRREWRAGTITEDAQSVYEMIKAKHLMFSESQAEKEIRIDHEFAALTKGKYSGHQFEPLFEEAITELESVGLGKSVKELFLSYLRKIGPNLSKLVRKERRIWLGEDTLRAPISWEEARKVVLEHESNEDVSKASAQTVFVANEESPAPKGQAKAQAKKFAALESTVAALRSELQGLGKAKNEGGRQKSKKLTKSMP